MLCLRPAFSLSWITNASSLRKCPNASWHAHEWRGVAGRCTELENCVAWKKATATATTNTRTIKINCNNSNNNAVSVASNPMLQHCTTGAIRWPALQQQHNYNNATATANIAAVADGDFGFWAVAGGSEVCSTRVCNYGMAWQQAHKLQQQQQEDNGAANNNGAVAGSKCTATISAGGMLQLHATATSSDLEVWKSAENSSAMHATTAATLPKCATSGCMLAKGSSYSNYWFIVCQGGCLSGMPLTFSLKLLFATMDGIC